jgi:surfeit locus 1 family protein
MIASFTHRMRCYRFDWKLSLLTALLLPLMISLGFWQLRREDEKLALQAQYEQRQYEIPTAISALTAQDDLQYRQVRLVGVVDSAHTYLLDNRIYQGQAGYEVIVPVVTPEGMVVLLNRGWIAPGATRAELPVIPAMPAELSVQGSIYQSVGETLVLGDSLESDGWPKVVQALDPVRLAGLAGYGANSSDAAAGTAGKVAASAMTIFPYSVRIAEAQPGVLTRYWPVISTTPEKHRGYAVQWFLMATALVLLYFYYSTRTEA